MARWKAGLGLVAGLMIVLSGGAHSFLGWKSLSQQLADARVPLDLVGGLKIGWHFGGAAMAIFGLILIATFARRWRGESVMPLPALIIAVGYLLFGTWALAISGNPFFTVFIVPAVLILVASLGGVAR